MNMHASHHGHGRNYYQVCSRCVMDTTDPDIVFDEDGVCNHCKKYETLVADRCMSYEQGGKQHLEAMVERIKRDGKGKDYDCIIGVSGGVDSTYVAYLAKKVYGLRPLAVHLDNGWDSELAVSNIHNIVSRLEIDLYTHVIDWEEFKDLQVAFLRASTPDGEMPTDHAIVALLKQAAAKHKTKWIIHGSNARTEGIIPYRYCYGSKDTHYILSVYRRFATTPIRTWPYMSIWRWVFLHYVAGIRELKMLNYIDFDKAKTTQLIQDELGWRPYGGKHHESVYTRFYYSYILPRKFDVDLRKCDYSCLIMAGQMTRDEALEKLREDPYTPQQFEQEKAYVLKKLGLTEAQFDEIMNAPVKSYLDYPNHFHLQQKMLAIRNGIGWLRRRR